VPCLQWHWCRCPSGHHMMVSGKFIVGDCPTCGALHPVYFDGYAGIDGDDVMDCPVAGKLELSDLDHVPLREVVSIKREDVDNHTGRR
jgi:hypothetical protein